MKKTVLVLALLSTNFCFAQTQYPFQNTALDPASMVKWAQTTESVLESDEHKAHSLKMARQSLVLLKNEANTLPLKKAIKKIAVVGPNAHNAVAVLGNYNGKPSTIVTALQGIRDKLGRSVEVVYEKAINFTNDTLEGGVKLILRR